MFQCDSGLQGRGIELHWHFHVLDNALPGESSVLTYEGCQVRQRRVAASLREQGIDAAVFFSTFAARYLTGAIVDQKWPQVVLLTASDECVLITNLQPREAACAVELYTGYTLERPFNRLTATHETADLLRARLTPGLRLGIDADWANHTIVSALNASDCVGFTPAFTQIRRRKDEDELACMRAVVAVAEAGYGAARNALRPGISEYELYGVIVAAMAAEAKTSVSLGGDFTAGIGSMRGGPPTAYKIEEGDCYILDMYPTLHGYHAGLCRTFIAGTPSPEQTRVWKQIMEAHDIAADMLKPGVRCSDVFHAIKAHLDKVPYSFPHHAGHGVGMMSWETPWLTPGSDHVLVEGEVVAVEPGLYDESLRGGVRLEHNYLITTEGGKPLDSFPMAL